MKFPLLARGAIVLAIAIAILFPIEMIRGKVLERQARATEVVQAFAAETSGPQVLAGPFIALTCEETFTQEREIKRGGKAETIAETKVRACPTLLVAPRSLRVDGVLPVERRHRGIYEILVYRASIELAGELEWPAAPAQDGPDKRMWKKAYLVMGVSDARGIKEIVPSTSFSAAVVQDAVLQQFALREPLGEFGSRKPGSIVPFQFRAEIMGTSSLHILPAGHTTQIRLRSDWPHPSFSSAWSPDNRAVTAAGFDAQWRMSSVATGGQATWNRLAHEARLLQAGSGAGVLLFEPINAYTLSCRAVEYSFLFVLFTFASLALTEAIAGIRLHGMHYALVGSALAVFFLLLLSISEHLAFGAAYAIAASACILLLTVYLRHPLGSAKRAAAFSGIFVAIYGALYVLLRSEDHALLMGSLMVFATLALVMLATRRLDWSAVAQRMLARTG